MKNPEIKPETCSRCGKYHRTYPAEAECSNEHIFFPCDCGKVIYLEVSDSWKIDSHHLKMGADVLGWTDLVDEDEKVS